ncbi:MAG: 4-hydroxy-3-methylbut-2-enyl diphosphate reductase [Bacteroidetes bacterium]|nr:4-hydroxy-3-methylbut-2-enyl diphosphate reductase [Bacteroidota bacterium]
MKTFNVPEFYRSKLISKVKTIRKTADSKKKDFTPTLLDFGSIRFYLARHFGFCYGVENAIEISFKAVEENPGKRIFLISQMIHNPEVNKDLVSRGVQFLMDTEGNQLFPFEDLKSDDIVIIPAFGTTLEIEKKLSAIGVEVHKYNTTCPFVERVWNKSEKLGKENYTIIIHGKHKHEETRATFSRSETHAPSIVVKDLEESKILGNYILGKVSKDAFEKTFANRYSSNFDPDTCLERVGVINQTTMLATDTQEIAEYFKQIMITKHGEQNSKNHFSDTRDTLCYATNENQDSTYGLLEINADMAIVVGGYNSSNTSHLVELCERKFPTYFISSEKEIESRDSIHHFNYHEKKHLTTTDFLPRKSPLTVIITSGASCPDSVIENVILKMISFFDAPKSAEEVLKEIEAAY